MSEPGVLRSPERYAQAAVRRRTERFNPCFPRGITLGDIDSFVEINHHFLFIEWKSDDQRLLAGQAMALYRLSRQPKTSVWIIWTSADGFVTHGQRLGTHGRRVSTTEESVRQRITEWAELADAHVQEKRMGA